MTSRTGELDNATSAIDSRLRAVVGEVLEIAPDQLQDGLRREETPTWDSLNHLRLITALEETFEVTFPMREIAELTTFGAIRKAIAERL